MSQVVTDVNLSSGRVDYGEGGGGLPAGGTAGQYLVKHSSTDQDAEWITPSPRLGYDTVNGVTYISIIED